jgi:hypothetical protein
MSFKVPYSAAGAAGTVERDRCMTELERRIVWSREQVTSANRRGTDSCADRQIHQIINANPCTERTLAKNRDLCVVLQEGWESECSADRTGEISTWEAWTKVRGLHRNASPRIERAGCTDPDSYQSTHRVSVFACSVLSRQLQRADACSNDCLRAISYWRRCSGATKSCAICTHEGGAHLSAAKIKREHGCISGWLH